MNGVSFMGSMMYIFVNDFTTQKCAASRRQRRFLQPRADLEFWNNEKRRNSHIITFDFV